MEKLSFVIPCYGGERLVKQTIEELIHVVSEKSEYRFEIITVNDCSPDNELAVLKELAAEYSFLKVVDLAKNMGKHAALMAGYAYAKGDFVVSLDDDGQCPVDKLWELIAPLKEGQDVVIAKYGKKSQSTFKNFGSKLNDIMARAMLDKPKELQLGSFFAISQYVCEELKRYHNPYTYIDGLLLRTTSKIVNVEMADRERKGGGTTFTIGKLLGLWVNGLTAFSVKPLRIATIIGSLVAVLGFVFAAYTVIRKIVTPDVMLGYSSIMAVLLVIGGMLMLMLGLVGEYLGRIYICLNQSPQYVVRDTINIGKDRNDKKRKKQSREPNKEPEEQDMK